MKMISLTAIQPIIRIGARQEIEGIAVTSADKKELFEQVLENRKTVFWICLGYARDSVEAEELAQEVFFKAWSRIDSLRTPERCREWLFRVARNTCLDSQKKKRLRRLFEANSPREARDEKTPEALIILRDELRLLKQAVRALPNKMRSTFILREYGELSYQEIADILGIKEGTVMSRLNGAREKIRERMKGLSHGK
jgi:RNA polymerase sigma-70 factor (ECF subfamily)